MAIILSINSGSSSVKVSIYKSGAQGEPPVQLADAQISGLTAPPATLTYERSSEKLKGQEIKNINSNEDACEYILDHLVKDEGLLEISSRNDITHVCHRVVHGGDYPTAHVIDKDTYHHLEELTDLAPLHNASALAIIKACNKALPEAKNIAYFDSSFHDTIPEAIRTYPIDPEIANKNKLRKYGFHGISYAFITRSVAEYLGKPENETSIIALHLGSGASACAIQNGKSLDNSMGLTPLAGLPGATRSGDVDPSLIFHFTHDAGKPSRSSTQKMHISQAEEILNKQSGWKALTGTTDFGEISSSQEPKCKLAFDIFVDRILVFVGSYYIKLNGKVDALVFAGGIGEKAALLRTKVVEKCECLGFELDQQTNNNVIEDVFEMARQCAVGLQTK
ncbi:acetate kinase, partial [Lecanoromycetidae sp. Uapishka_2]